MLSKIINTVFTDYLIVLTIGSGIILGIILPYTMSQTRYRKEYTVGKFIGYFYMLIGALMFAAARIF